MFHVKHSQREGLPTVKTKLVVSRETIVKHLMKGAPYG